MIILLTGDDISSILFFIKSRKSAYASENIFEFESESFAPGDVVDFAYSTSMFGDRKLIIVNAKRAVDVEFGENFLDNIRKTKSVELIIRASKINKNTRVYKLLKEYARIQEFKLPKDYTNFRLSDAIFIKQDKKEALKIISGIRDLDANFHGVIWAIHNSVRNRVSMEFDNATWNNLHPFVKRKTEQAVKLGEDKVRDVYRNLFDLDAKLKSTNAPRLGLIQDFVIYSI